MIFLTDDILTIVNTHLIMTKKLVGKAIFTSLAFAICTSTCLAHENDHHAQTVGAGAPKLDPRFLTELPDTSQISVEEIDFFHVVRATSKRRFKTANRHLQKRISYLKKHFATGDTIDDGGPPLDYCLRLSYHLKSLLLDWDGVQHDFDFIISAYSNIDADAVLQEIQLLTAKATEDRAALAEEIATFTSKMWFSQRPLRKSKVH